MTRTEFEAMYQILFPELARSLVRAGYQDGPDAMQTVYVSCIEDKSYRGYWAKDKAWLETQVWNLAKKQHWARMRELTNNQGGSDE
jgi:hypothetical protein